MSLIISDFLLTYLGVDLIYIYKYVDGVNPVVQEPTFPPLTCQDFVERSDLYWPSVRLGILFGLLLAQLLDLLGST